MPSVDLPTRRERSAPSFKDSEPQGLIQYFSDLEALFLQHAVFSDQERKQAALQYPSVETERLWKTTAAWKDRTKSYSDFKAEVLKLYPEVSSERSYRLQDLEATIAHHARTGIYSAIALGEYYRRFTLISEFLIERGRYSLQEQSRAFFRGLGPSLQAPVIQRLQQKFIDHHPDDPYRLSAIFEAAHFALAHITSITPAHLQQALEPCSTPPALDPIDTAIDSLTSTVTEISNMFLATLQTQQAISEPPSAKATAPRSNTPRNSACEKAAQLPAHITAVSTAAIFMQEIADQQLEAERQPAQRSEKAALHKSSSPTPTAHPRTGEAIAFQLGLQIISTTQNSASSHTSGTATTQAHQAVTDELATLMAIGQTLEDDIPTTQQAPTSAVPVLQAPAALAISATTANSAHSVPFSPAATIAASAPLDPTDTYSGQKTISPTIPHHRTTAQYIRKSAIALPSRSNVEILPTSEVGLFSNAKLISEARAPQRDSNTQEDIILTSHNRADPHFRPHYRIFRPAHCTFSPAHQSASILTFLGSEPSFSFRAGQKAMGSVPTVRSSVTERASPVSCISGMPDIILRHPCAPKPLKLITFVAARVLPQRPSVGIISDPEEPSDAPSTAPSLTANIPTHITPKQRPNAAHLGKWAKLIAPRKFLGCGPYFPATPTPKIDQVARQAVALPKRQEDLVRIKAEDQTAHRSTGTTGSANANSSSAPTAAKDAPSDRHCDDSGRGTGEASNLSVGRRSPHIW